ncbi:nuclear transport factor 2 family protein [Streptomyces sp. 4N509B]|uniref:nuclear transport factor 2 family protein n=1 Tax=Streptomyces sp. 4N509B TaxID=3457413 RepID=UPI003FD146C2
MSPPRTPSTPPDGPSPAAAPAQAPALAADVARLLDEAAVTRLVHRFSACLDGRDWTGYGQTFTEDGVFEILGQRRVGPTEIAAAPARNLARYARTQHHNTNVTVEVDGDEATATSSVLAVHVPDAADPGTHTDVGGVYHYRCRRTPEGWRFAHVRLEVTWTAGPPLFSGLPDPRPEPPETGGAPGGRALSGA